jgi:hypothetical protein
MNRTLPLFEGLEAPRLQVSERPRGAPALPAPPSTPAAVRAPEGDDRHLRAAWRLSRGMWRYPEYSPEQTKAGLAICRHLQALLAETDEGGRPD